MPEFIMVESVVLELSSMVYQPRDDSFAMLDELLKQQFDNVMEIGCGSGILGLVLLAQNKIKQLLAVDINYCAVQLALHNATTNKLEVQFVCTSLGSCFRQGSFPATIIFNPPYLPFDPEIDDKLPLYEYQQFVGGIQGTETVLALVEQIAPENLYTIISSEATALDTFRDTIPNYNMDVMHELKLGFEKLWLIHLHRKS